MAASEQEALERAEALFREQFGREPELRARAPGRVNLIGEHTDYNDGFVFPAAIDRDVWICASPSKARTKLVSAELGPSTAFRASHVSLGDLEGWSAYAAGIAWALRERTGQPLSDIEAVVHGEVPIGSGVSSSAAIELAFAVTWNVMDELGLPNKELAKIGQRCENKFVGVNSGIMDQMASAMGKADHAMFLDTRSLDLEYVRIPDSLKIALCDTGKQRSLTDSAYNERRDQCEEACKVLGVKALRDATIEDLDRHKSQMDRIVYNRSKHVITENERCIEFKHALAGDKKREIGELMKASHESLRDLYEVSSKELDAMAEAAWNSTGCVGARMTGAGFGGACVALVETNSLADFITETAMAYKKNTGLGGNFMACNASDGAQTLS